MSCYNAMPNGLEINLISENMYHDLSHMIKCKYFSLLLRAFLIMMKTLVSSSLVGSGLEV
jgi:hypothetical protein